MSDVNWVAIAVGLLALAVGVAILVFRAPLATVTAKLQRATFGRIAEPIASRVTSRGLIFPGIVWITIGAVILFFGGIKIHW